MTLDPESWKNSLSMETSLLWTAVTRDRPTVYHHIDIGEAPPTPEETPPGKTVRCGRDARGHAVICGYRRVREPLIIPHRSCLKEVQGPALLYRLQEIKWCNKEGLFHCPGLMTLWTRLLEPNGSPLSTWRAVIGRWIYTRMTSRRLRNRSRALAFHSHALWPLQCSSDIWEVNGDRLKQHHDSRFVYLGDVIVIGCTFQEHLVQPAESVPAVVRSLLKA
jgi:hypothetical protein